MHRRDLKKAPYNPRSIDASAAKKLRENIRKKGMIQPPIWNERTGNIVGGHQRVTQLDILEDTDDYYLDVAVVDLSEKDEKAQNVFLNNIASQGSFDLDLLGDLIKTDNLDADSLGFDAIDLQVMFDDPTVAATGTAFDPESDPATKEVETAESFRKKKKDWQQKKDKERDAHNYVVAVFDSADEVTAFLAANNFDVNSKYINGRKLASMLGVDVAVLEVRKIDHSAMPANREDTKVTA